ncbi:MAG: hypothetical protein CBD60_03530 [Flavobacteriaceae bacterium TMED200]|nr:MAG: hypothetical protein CBD60_03530 [Flavobacteriaceae bacterium TMED200]|tara:strand:+ start:59 stop:532 length:474 start_codon:yes stop_codon:yes gene_type:complete
MKKLIFPLFILIFIGCDKTKNTLKIVVDPLVIQMFDKYVDAWSKQEYQKITNEIYDVPFSLYLQDSTSIFNTKEEIKSFLKVTFSELEKNNYGYSIRNQWEHYKVDNDLVVIEMNFTRFYKDSTIMGDNQRTASYILRKTNGVFKISGMIPHTNVSN